MAINPGFITYSALQVLNALAKHCMLDCEPRTLSFQGTHDFGAPPLLLLAIQNSITDIPIQHYQFLFYRQRSADLGGSNSFFESPKRVSRCKMLVNDLSSSFFIVAKGLAL